MSRKTKPLLEVDANLNPIQDSNTWTTVRMSYSGANLQYVGIARAGSSTAEAVWQIFQLNYDGSSNLISKLWPINSSGAISTDFEFIWNNRAALSYA